MAGPYGVSYGSIDPGLTRWAARHSLLIATEYKDSVVRSTDVVGRTGKKVQIWVDPPDRTASIRDVWDHRSSRADLVATESDLERVLDSAHAIAREWVDDT